MKLLELLQTLSNAFGPPGGEEPVRQIIIEALRGHVDEMRVDALGNLHVLKRGTGARPGTVMVAAHMDEVSLMVIGPDNDNSGTFRFRAAGGFDDRVLIGKGVVVGPERLHGVIGVKPIHLLRGNERTAVVKIDSLRIDLGAENKESANRLVKPGDYAVFATQFGPLGVLPDRPEGRLLKGKAIDDRIGCAVLIDVLRGKPLPCDVVGVFTVQEEIGLRGARVAAFAVDPVAAFVLECTTADDLPKEHDLPSSTFLGRGPAVTTMDRTMLTDRRLSDFIFKVANARHIPCQMKQPGTGGTDAGAIHLVRAGIPSAVIALPGRYIHSPVTVCDPQDALNMAKLARAVLERFDPAILAR